MTERMLEPDRGPEEDRRAMEDKEDGVSKEAWKGHMAIPRAVTAKSRVKVVAITKDSKIHTDRRCWRRVEESSADALQRNGYWTILYGAENNQNPSLQNFDRLLGLIRSKSKILNIKRLNK